MRGTDCTADQIAHAREFVEGRGWTPGLDKAIITLDDLSRLVAWYGAMRYEAAIAGNGGTLESPGAMVVALTRRELAGVLGVHMQTITKWERDGMPVSTRGSLGKPTTYNEPDVRAWLQQREPAPLRYPRPAPMPGTVERDPF